MHHPQAVIAVSPLSTCQPGCPICLETVGGDDVWKCCCGCVLHYSCLVQYLHAKVGDRGGLSLKGVSCPNGAQCASLAIASAAPPSRLPGPPPSVHFIALADLDNLVDYGKHDEAAATLRDRSIPPLTHTKVADLRSWLEEGAALEALRAWLGDLRVTEDERRQLVRRGEPAFDALVRRGSAAPGGQPEQSEQLEQLEQPEQPGDLTAELAATLRARLRPLREGYTDELDPFVAATTKACPTCSMRSTHWHGHQCHHISPYTQGCPACRNHYCYRCLATEADNWRERGERGKCLCGYWSTWCRDINTQEDVDAFVVFKDGLPLDSRCGCVVCPECRYREPCASCPGNCGVCRGVLNPAPDQANPPNKWVALRRPQGLEAKLKARMWEACRQGDEEALAAVLAEASDGGTGLVNGRDREWRTCLINAADGGHAACIALLLRVPGVDVNLTGEDGCSALIRSCTGGHIECVRLLLAHPQINVNHVDGNGDSPLIWCSFAGHTECVRLLLAHPGIDANLVDKGDRTALDVAKHDEMRALLSSRPEVAALERYRYIRKFALLAFVLMIAGIGCIGWLVLPGTSGRDT